MSFVVLSEAAQALFEGLNIAVKRRRMAENRHWRVEDLEWRDNELSRVHLERNWRNAEAEQRLLDNARHIWKRFVDHTRTMIEEKVELLTLFAGTAVLFGGFSIVGLVEFGIPADALPNLKSALAATVAMAITCFMLSMLISSLMAASVLRVGRDLTDEVAESAFIDACLEYAAQHDAVLAEEALAKEKGTGGVDLAGAAVAPPRPARTFDKMWATSFERDWNRALLLFMAGIPCCFAMLGLIAAIKFPNSIHEWIYMEIVLFVAYVVMAVRHFRLVRLLLTRDISTVLERELGREQEGVPEIRGFPYDWHLTRNPHEPFKPDAYLDGDEGYRERGDGDNDGDGSDAGGRLDRPSPLTTLRTARSGSVTSLRTSFREGAGLDGLGETETAGVSRERVAGVGGGHRSGAGVGGGDGGGARGAAVSGAGRGMDGAMDGGGSGSETGGGGGGTGIGAMGRRSREDWRAPSASTQSPGRAEIVGWRDSQP